LVEAEHARERFAERGETQSPTISPRGLAAWDRRTVLFDYPPAIRRVIYPTFRTEAVILVHFYR
jgi:putative transposase